MRRRSATLGTAALALAGALLVWFVSTTLFPYHSLNHDEAVYLQQAAMLLEGQLYLDPPVEGVLRPWFFVDAPEGMYPKYAPVPAAMFAVGELFGGYRLTLVAVAAGNLALAAGVVREAFDARTGLLAGVLVLASPLFVLNSSVFLPYAPTHFLNLAFAYCYLRADRTESRRWAAGAGAAVGLAFFARPYTAVLFALPFVGHALWTLRDEVGVDALRDPVALVRGSDAVGRQATTAALGLVGVGLALGYNTVVTGHALTFPYAAFAPLDGLGFGQRRILSHEVVYTPELALEANGRVLWIFFAKWIAGGLVTAALAGLGVAVAARRGLTARQAPLAALLVSIPLGNVYFWGNFNVLGGLDTAGDGLVSALGPYYHFDLLLPTATFAAVVVLAVAGRVRAAVAGRRTVDARAGRVAAAVALLLLAGAVGAVTADIAREPVERNAEVTDSYERAYEPFEGGPPVNSLILLPDPYGNWLNHPFQAVRNDPGYDGRAVYAIDDRPFATADAFPDRRLHRYAYRGGWAPYDGSPSAARLQRVEDVRGDRLALDATVGVPAGADSVTVRVGTDDGSLYRVANGANSSVDFRLVVTDERVAVEGLGGPEETLAVDGVETVHASAFVDYGPGGSFTYRFDLPVDATDGRVRALTPEVELCRGVRSCGGAAAYVPETAPDGVSVETDLTATERDT
ncbi:glycosyltransferase family 39 protein [Halosimplex litoreum]|uniref:Glycosyltransferase family 39 protein n=1 Tax=Halosimplex litoreum TaxID=1198301 RepID=A0A7T3FYA9_9EURY|nr:glycosyltransferase family 39 protein [Halosimplex litoreum]QPV62958.1 glycosyltransferase family 39 protein [Halosimplex litoreum]